MVTRLTSFDRAWLLIVSALVLWLPGASAQVGLRDPVTVAGSVGQGAAAGYTASATTFDGATYMTRGTDLSGLSDGQKGTISLWIKYNGGNGSYQRILYRNGAFVVLDRTSGDKFMLQCYDSGSVKRLDLTSVNTWNSTSGWIHLFVSWDMATAGARHLWVNGVDETAVTTFSVGSTLAYSGGSNWGFGATDTGSTKCNACISEPWVSFTSYWEPSANITKWRTAGGKPTGNNVIDGVTPILYLPNLYGTFQNNAGTGGNFTVNGVGLTSCAGP